MSFNPNAPSFTFQPGAGSFVPRSQQQQQQQPFDPSQQPQQQQPGGYPQYGQYQQQPQYGQYQGGGYGGYQGGGYQAGGGYQPHGGYQGGYQAGGGYGGQGFQPPQVQPRYASPSAAAGGPSQAEQLASLPPKVLSLGGGGATRPSQAEQLAALPPKVLSLGGGGAAAAAPKPFVRKEATETPKPAATLSLGGAKTDKPKVVSLGAKPTPAAAPAAAAPAPAAPAAPAAAAAAPAAAPAPAAAAAPAPKKAQDSATYNAFSRQSASTNSDAVLAEAQKHLDEDVLKDLYGGRKEDENAKEHMNLVFIGHVDAGKSTMGGQLLYLTGMVDKRTLEKFEKEAKEAGRESWYLSWALDSTPQERAKGKTVEVGRAYFETDKRRYTILDAPGHKTYVPSMISGAAQADVALLVISARKGEFEAGFDKGGQTREHAQLVKTAGVTRLIIVVNKMDDPTVNWEQERFDFIKTQLTNFLKKGIFNPKDVTFIPVSAFTGANMKEQVSKEVCPWNTSPSLLNFLDGMKAPDRNINGPVMLPISEKYNDLGTIIVGKIESGRIYKGDTLLMMPNRTSVEVTTIYDEVNEELEAAFSGDNVRIRLKGVTDEDVTPGYVLTSPQKPIKTTTQFQAQLAILESKSIICAGYSCVMHAHTAAEEVTLVKLLHYLEAKTGRKSKKPPQFAKTGQQIIALIETTQTVCLEKFADYPQLGRFTLRDEGKTIAIGKVTKLITPKELADAVPDVGALALGDSTA